MRIVGQIVIILLTQERDDLLFLDGLTIVCLLDLPRSCLVCVCIPMFLWAMQPILIHVPPYIFSECFHHTATSSFRFANSAAMSFCFANPTIRVLYCFICLFPQSDIFLHCHIYRHRQEGRSPLDDQAPRPAQQRKSPLPKSAARGCHQEREGTQRPAPAYPIFGENIPRNVRMPMAIIRCARREPYVCRFHVSPHRILALFQLILLDL